MITTLLIEDHNQDEVRATLTTATGLQSAQVTLPLHSLQRTGVDELLGSGTIEQLASRTSRYGQLLMDALQGPFSVDLRAEPLRVVVRTGPRLQTLAWEVLRALGDEDGPIDVVRTVAAASPTVIEPSRWELVWLAARAENDSIPRYRVAGPVLSSLFNFDCITPRWVSTDTTAELLKSLADRLGGTSEMPSILHLDVHGTTVTHAPTQGTLDSGFVAWFGSQAVTDATLLDLALRIGCRIFVSNACHGGDQRDISRLSLPAQLISSGLHAAVVARGPVPERVAPYFHEVFYTSLASGSSVYQAHTAAIRSSCKEAGDSDDLRAQAMIQPMLWLADDSDDRPLCPPAQLEVDLGMLGGVYLRAAAEDGTIASALAALEQERTNGYEFPRIEAHDPDVTVEAQSAFNEVMCWAMGWPVGNAGGSPASRRVLRVRSLTFSERRILLRHAFGSDSPLVDVLGVLVPGDIIAISLAAALAERDVGTALLRAVEFGPMAVGVDELDDETRAAAEKVLVHFPPDEYFRACLAMPVLAIGRDTELAQVWLPPAPKEFGTDDGPQERIRLMRAGSGFVAVPDKSVRDAARVLSRPHTLVARRLSEAWTSPPMERVPRTRWSETSAWACAAHLVLAVAARQVGSIDIDSSTKCGLLLSNSTLAAATRLIGAIHRGLPHWPEIHPEMQNHATEFVQQWDDQNNIRWLQEASGQAVYDDPTKEAEPQPERSRSQSESTTGIQTGSHSATSEPDRDRSKPATELSTREQARARAYDVAEAGDLEDALRIAVKTLADASIEDRFDYCESLHLLGDIQERLGRWQAAATWFAKEREIDPPTNHRRLHNREHYFRLLHDNSASPDLQFSLASEAASIARQMGNSSALAQAIDRMLMCGLESSRGDWVREGLAAAETSEEVSEGRVHLAEGYLAIDVDTARAIGKLERAAVGDDSYAAHALLLLAVIDDTNTIRHLRRGARLSNGRSYSELCLDTLLLELMSRALIDELRSEISSIDHTDRSRPPVWYARAGLALLDSLDSASERLADALTTDGGQRLSLFYKLNAELKLPRRSFIDAVLLLTGYLESRDNLRNPSMCPVAPLAAAQNLARLARFFEGSDRRWVIAQMLRCSERAWDGGSPDNMALAAALRSHACEELAILGEPEDMTAYARELGWLATIQRSRGRPTDAERAFQQAILLAPPHLPEIEAASLTGRYGNLLHDLGEISAAVHLQWRGVRLAFPELALTDHVSHDALSAALAAATRRNATELKVLNVLFINLANCLADAGSSQLARAILASLARQPGSQDLPSEVAALWQSIEQRTRASDA